MSWDPNQGQGQNPYQQGPYGGYNPPQQPGNPYEGQQGGYQQGPYGTQYGSPQYGAPPMAGAAPGASSIGMQPNVAAGLGYLVPIIGLIFFFIEKQSRFVKFNGAQVILLDILAVVWVFVIIIASVFAALIDSSGSLFVGVSCLTWVGYLAIFVGWLIAMIQAFMGKTFKLPLIGNLADRMAGPALT
jgi:uncharacterized membrane protein